MGPNRKQNAPLEKQNQRVRRRFNRQRVLQFIGPSEKLAWSVKSHDRACAVLKGLATTNDPVDDHEDIVGRVSFADNGAVAPVADRSTPY